MKNLSDIERYAKENYVPIARKGTTKYLVSLFNKHNYQSFLEIGTAIGYTSIIIASINPNIKITTLEYDLDRAEEARQNFIDFHVSKQIRLVIDDAQYYEDNALYDVIFIDAAKKRNQFFLDKFSKNLNENGTIIIDNMNLDDFWVDANVDKKNEYQKVTLKFKEHLLQRNDFHVEIFDDIGDGIAVLTKK